LDPPHDGSMKHTLSAGDRTPQTSRARKTNGAGQTRPVSRVPKGRPLGLMARDSAPTPDQPASPGVRVRAGSPAAILAIVPHLLGFLPASSLVVIGIEPPKGSVRVTLRYDLPDPADAHLAADIAEHAMAVLKSQRLAAAMFVGYGPDALVRPLAVAFKDAARVAGIDLPECVRADGGRYWSYKCGDEACCPEEGVPFDSGSHPVAAAMTAAGEQVLADRDALAASIAPVTGAEAGEMRWATRRAEQHVVQIIARVRRSTRLGAARHMIACEGLAAVGDMIALYRRGGTYSTEYQLAWLTVALKDLRVRDDAWARMDPEDSDAHRRLWIDVVRRAQPGHVAAPASLLAFVAWQEGNGALANVALDRALADNAGYSMALLLRQVITAGAPPSMARLPMTPDEVAACYDDLDEDRQDDDSQEDEDEDEDDSEDDEDEGGDDEDDGVYEDYADREVNSSHSPDDQEE
jgi:Domain of unknown function (DUF4192)